jgi:hypothetical protein
MLRKSAQGPVVRRVLYSHVNLSPKIIKYLEILTIPLL